MPRLNAFDSPSRVTPPERNGVLQEFEENCLSRQASFSPSCNTQWSGGNLP
jgi:hypothetical protein